MAWLPLTMRAHYHVVEPDKTLLRKRYTNHAAAQATMDRRPGRYIVFKPESPTWACVYCNQKWGERVHLCD